MSKRDVMHAVPGLDALRAEPERANELPREVLLRLMLEAQAVLAVCAVAVASRVDGVRLGGADADRLLTVAEAAGRLSVSPKWIYSQPDLPFVVRISERKLRVSEVKLQRWLKTLKSE